MDDRLDVLLPYQRAWVADESKLILGEKSRRVGISWAEALKAVLKGMVKSGVNTYYLSYNKEMTRQFIQDAKFWAGFLDIAAEEMEEEVVVDGEAPYTVYRLTLASGRVIEGLPSKGYALRSKQGRVVLDEAAFADEFEEIRKSALALLIWGGSFTIISSHNGEENPFNTLVKDVRSGKERDWSLHRVTFSDAVRQGFYRRVCLVAGKPWTAEGEDEWVAEIRRIYKDNVEEELDVIPKRGGNRYFPRAMLDTCVVPDIEIVRLVCKDDFMWQPPEKRARKVRQWFSTEVAPILKSLEGPAYFGQDFARSGDLSFIWIAEGVSMRDLDTRIIIEMRNVPYDQQWQIVRLIAETSRVFGGAAFDARGNGQALAEVAAQEYPGSVSMIMLTRGWYAEWFPKLKSKIESREFLLPDDEYILADFGAVTIKNGVPLIADQRTADRDGKGGAGGQRHGDGAVAAVLCHFAWIECSGDPAPVVAVGGRQRDRIFSGY